MKRAVRRHHKRRMKAKARVIYWYCAHPEKNADNLTPCSCQMCRNPRHSNYCKGNNRLTIQERKFAEVTE